MATSGTQTKTSEVAVTPQNQLEIVKKWGNDFSNLVTTQNVTITPTEREFAMSIITNLSNRCIASGINPKELNMTDFLEQVKHNSKLQLSINEQELFLDIRNDKNTGLKNVKISRQYQGEEKLMIKYCTKKIARFKKDVVCKGDIFVTTEDFDLGITKISKHTKNENINRNDFANIDKVYYIAYVEEYGTLVPYTIIVDKQRLLRARNAATTDTIWAKDTVAMCLKTGSHLLWKFMKPYIKLPIELQESFVATEDEMDWDKPIINENATYDIPTTENTQTESIDVIDVVETPQERKEEEKSDNSFEVHYNEYKNNKEKYERLDYNEETKMVLVKLK